METPFEREQGPEGVTALITDIYNRVLSKIKRDKSCTVTLPGMAEIHTLYFPNTRHTRRSIWTCRQKGKYVCEKFVSNHLTFFKSAH